jgi:ribonuclease-3
LTDALTDAMRDDGAARRFRALAFADPALLAQALRHRSAGTPHNERLEFLGDALVNLFIAEALFARWPQADEGALTRARAELVRESALAPIARELELGAQLTLGPGELKSGGHRRDSILADALEAVVAAIYLDAGFEACRATVMPWFEAAMAALPPPHKVGKDAKTRLQEWLQARQKPLPVYSLLSESGEEHAKIFQVSCMLTEPAVSTEGEGSSRRAAEQVAAEAALERISPRST